MAISACWPATEEVLQQPGVYGSVSDWQWDSQDTHMGSGCKETNPQDSYTTHLVSSSIRCSYPKLMDMFSIEWAGKKKATYYSTDESCAQSQLGVLTTRLQAAISLMNTFSYTKHVAKADT